MKCNHTNGICTPKYKHRSAISVWTFNVFSKNIKNSVEFDILLWYRWSEGHWAALLQWLLQLFIIMCLPTRQVYSAHKEHGETNMENRLNVTTMHPSELLNHIHKFNMSNSFYLSLSASMFVISASHSLHAGEVMWCRDSLNLYGTRT